MHIPDGIMSTPIATGGFLVAGAALSLTLRHANKNLDEKQIPLLGITGAFIFAAQMINFPVGAGTSGHFMGAAFAALLLGPLNGFLIMTVILAIQCLLFADGGLTALGINTMNMGLVAGLIGYGVFHMAQHALPKTRQAFLIAAGFAAWISIVACSAACAAELLFSGAIPAALVPAMLGVHAVIGLGEALLTVGALITILQVRPELIHAWPGQTPPRQTMGAPA
jgi:cobalt/nickel transport system permease protein